MAFDYASLIHQYGYVATFAGTLIEGGSLWSACWAGAGYLLGRAAEHVLGDLARIERELFGGVLLLVAIGVVAASVRRVRHVGKG
jgi:membrane protein DedA with SNARE-associated domain